MGTRIYTNTNSLRGLFNLQRTQEAQSQVLTRLSTGSQINSGRDNPAGLISSETLRAQITSIQQSIQNSNRANNVIGTADAALGQVGDLLNQIKGLVQQGVNNGALSLTEVQANQNQIDSALDAINKISANTLFGGDKLLDGSKAFTTRISTADAAKLSDFQINQALFGSASTVNVSASVVSAATRGSLTYNAGNLTAQTTLQIGGSAGSQVFFFGNGTTATNIVTAVNANSDSTGVTAAITTAAVANSLNTGVVASNNAITFTDARQDAGASDSTISVTFTDPAANNATLGVTVNSTTNAINISLATNATGTITTTATQVINLIQNGNSAGAIAARALVSVQNTGASTGAGVVAAAASANLTGGSNAVITFTSSNFGSTEFADVQALAGSFATIDSTSTASTRSFGSDIVAKINGQNAYGQGLKASTSGALLSASVSFNAANNVAGTTATVTVTGGGSLFQIGQSISTSGQLGIGIEAVNTAKLGGIAGKLYQLGSGNGSSLLDVRSGNAQGSTLSNIIDQARDRVNTLRARLGAVQSNVIATNVSSLQTALTSLSDARSNIADTDYATETANLTRTQILNQAGISALQIANSSPNAVLSLLRQ
jgi:flagellin